MNHIVLTVVLGFSLLTGTACRYRTASHSSEYIENKTNMSHNVDGGATMSEQTTNDIFAKGNPAPAEYFTGTVWVNMLVTDEDNVYNTQAYDVRFEAEARTYWHSHPGGQLLFVTSGNGYYQEKGKPARPLSKGDVVEIPPHVVHWHGAAPDSPFVHLGASTRTDLGPAKWSGPVTDEEYEEATSR